MPLHDPGSGISLSIGSLWAAFRRQLRIIAACTALGLLSGLVVALASTRLYVAATTLIIGTPAVSMQETSASNNDRILDAGAVDSQVEVLRSDRIALAAAKSLSLVTDPRFMESHLSLRDRMRELLRGGPAHLTSEERARQLDDIVLKKLGDNVWVERVGDSYVLRITYVSPYPDLAAAIPNAFAAAYLDDQIDARIDAARRAGDWLSTRLADVKQRALDADLAAQRFRAENPVTPSAPRGTREADTAQRIVQLRQLEREAEAYRNFYQAMLDRYENALQFQSFPIASSRVVSPAVAPLRPSRPRKSLVLALAVLAGAGAGVAIGAFRELRDRSFRTGLQVRDTLALPYLGALPAAAPAAPVTETMLFRAPALRRALDAPLSPFADNLRGALAVVADLRQDQDATVIGLLSALPDEDRSAVAANLALLAARSGTRTLLVDGDLRRAALTRAVVPDGAARGLAETLVDPAGPAALAEACLADSETGLAFLPAAAGPEPGGRVIAPAAIETLRAWAAPNYRLVIVDLPAAALSNDARTATPALDGFLLVIRWGSTPRALVSGLLAENGYMRDKIIGALLTDVDTEGFARYADPNAPDLLRATA